LKELLETNLPDDLVNNTLRTIATMISAAIIEAITTPTTIFFFFDHLQKKMNQST
jgi:hypothetical protein